MRTRSMLPSWLRRSIPPLALASAIWHGAPVAGQSPSGEMAKKPWFHKDTAVILPITNIDDRLRAGLKEVQLWMKTPTGNWQRQQVVHPSQDKFRYMVPADGEYWFTLVTVDQRGIPKPADLNKLTAQEIVRVVIDTQPPTVDVQPMKSANGELLLHCVVNDANPDLASLRIACVGEDRQERPLEPMPGQPGTFRVPSPDWLNKAVFVTASDEAKNVVRREVNLRDSVDKLYPASNPAPITAVAPPPVIPTPVTSVTLPSAPPSGTTQNVQQAVGGPATPIGSVVVTSTPPQTTPMTTSVHNPVTTTANVQVIDSRPTQATPAPLGNAPAGGGGSGLQRHLLSTTKAALEYRIDQVGPSGVGKVEVWMTADQGATWKRLCEDTDKRSPAQFDLPGDGLFGVRVVVANGNGFGGRVPAPGEQPQLWVELDSVAPIVQLREVEPVANAGALDIRWTVSDKNLTTEPVSLYYATRKEGPWQPIARGIKNDGSFRWIFPRDVGPQFYLRLEAIDQAGNIARCDSQNALVLDTTEPRVTVVGVTGTGVIRQP